jgi:hypothetical protein
MGVAALPSVLANPGTTASDPASCAPAYPQLGYSGGYVCIASPTVGSRFDATSGGLQNCLYSGFGARSSGYWTCVDQGNVAPGDVVAINQNLTQLASGTIACQARGMTVENTTLYGQTFSTCKGTVSSVVSDVTTQQKLDVLHTDLSDKGTLHSDLGKLSTATTAPQTVTIDLAPVQTIGYAILAVLLVFAVMSILLDSVRTVGRMFA